MKAAKKIGFIYIEENPVTKSWKKYIGVLTDNYVYLYKDKKDVNYSSFYYIRNSAIDIIPKAETKGKNYCFTIKNKVNSGVFGFDKRTVMEEWEEALRKCKDDETQIIENLF